MVKVSPFVNVKPVGTMVKVIVEVVPTVSVEKEAMKVICYAFATGTIR